MLVTPILTATLVTRPSTTMVPQEKVHVAVLDAFPLIRAGFRTMLSTWRYGKVVVEARDRREYLRILTDSEIRLGVTLVDVANEFEGFATIRWIKDTQPEVIPVAITSGSCVKVYREALKAGAHGVLCKSIEQWQLLKAMDQLRVSQYCIDMALLGKVVDDKVKVSVEDAIPPERIAAAVTAKEREFLGHLVAPDDPTYAMIAERMGLSFHTVDSHRKNLFRKFGVNSRQGLFRAAVNWNLVPRQQ